jgi:hypothetical protein
MEEETDLFEEAVSVNSINSGSVWNQGSEYIGLSRCTVYHSAQELNIKGSDDEGSPMMATRHNTAESFSGSHENQVGAGVFWKFMLVIEIITSIT